jgi:hypothetical protein
MDTSISKMLKLVATLFVGGCFASSYLAVEASRWGDLIGFCWGAAVISGVFTLIWVFTAYQMADTLGEGKRSDITSKSIVSTAVAFPTVLASLCFVGGAVSAAMHGEYATAHWLLYGGAFCAAVLNVIWCVSEVIFVTDMKIKSRSAS